MALRIKPIETHYKGYKFRSRLEARWAVYFDVLGCEWEYEREGYDLGPYGRYLPDFWLKTVNMWAEVKAEPLTKEEMDRCKALVQGTGYPCILLVGPPDIKPYDVWESCDLVPDDDEDPHDEYCCDDQRLRLLDLLLTEEYLHSEHRFFWCPGGDEDPWPQQQAAVRAALSARFEHGESGYRR